MRQTKENLLKRNRKLEFENRIILTDFKELRQGNVNNDERIRKEFAKAFDWRKSDPYNYNKNEPRVPSWEEIFVKVSSLINRVNEANRLTVLEERLNDTGTELMNIRTLIEEKK